ncbi:uncharacterized protein [Dasypus novemcinctus]|uniref:uncharacterized protein n=1 Tax=Dasypus novemcinctus TaxID=9361 RepID=UPI0026605B4E|nr:uncharacterized protein LOC105746370 [Dasypus novemcinctus]
MSHGGPTGAPDLSIPSPFRPTPSQAQRRQEGEDRPGSWGSPPPATCPHQGRREEGRVLRVVQMAQGQAERISWGDSYHPPQQRTAKPGLGRRRGGHIGELDGGGWVGCGAAATAATTHAGSAPPRWALSLWQHPWTPRTKAELLEDQPPGEMVPERPEASAAASPSTLLPSNPPTADVLSLLWLLQGPGPPVTAPVPRHCQQNGVSPRAPEQHSEAQAVRFKEGTLGSPATPKHLAGSADCPSHTGLLANPHYRAFERAESTSQVFPRCSAVSPVPGVTFTALLPVSPGTLPILEGWDRTGLRVGSKARLPGFVCRLHSLPAVRLWASYLTLCLSFLICPMA